MLPVWSDNSSDIMSKLANFSQKCAYNIERAQRDTDRVKYLHTAIEEQSAMLIAIDSTRALVTLTLKNLEKFAKEKKERCLSSTKLSVYRANEIVKCSRPIILDYQPNSATFVNDLGLDVRLIEGGALRAILHFFLRSAVLNNTNCLQTLFLDEALAVLNDNRSADLSMYLPLIAKNTQMILIEQKSSIFENANVVTYNFKLEDGITRIKRC